MKASIILQLQYLDNFLFFPALFGWVGDTAAVTRPGHAIPVTVNKIEGPATTITLLGIQIDTISFELRLTVEKLKYISRLAKSWRTGRSGRSKRFQLAPWPPITCSHGHPTGVHISEKLVRYLSGYYISLPPCPPERIC